MTDSTTRSGKFFETRSSEALAYGISIPKLERSLRADAERKPPPDPGLEVRISHPVT